MANIYDLALFSWPWANYLQEYCNCQSAPQYLKVRRLQFYTHLSGSDPTLALRTCSGWLVSLTWSRLSILLASNWLKAWARQSKQSKLEDSGLGCRMGSALSPSEPKLGTTGLMAPATSLCPEGKPRGGPWGWQFLWDVCISKTVSKQQRQKTMRTLRTRELLNLPRLTLRVWGA